MQRHKIRDQLLPKYEGKPYSKDTFDVILQRRLDKLSTIVDKEYVARSAFYSIRKEMKDQVKILLEKHEIKTKIDQMTPQEIYAWKMFGAAFELLVQRKVMDALNEGRQHITSDELIQLFRDVMRQYRAPKVGNLYPREAGIVRDKKGKIKGKAIGIIGAEVRIKKREKEEG